MCVHICLFLLLFFVFFFEIVVARLARVGSGSLTPLTPISMQDIKAHMLTPNGVVDTSLQYQQGKVSALFFCVSYTTRMLYFDRLRHKSHGPTAASSCISLEIFFCYLGGFANLAAVLPVVFLASFSFVFFLFCYCIRFPRTFLDTSFERFLCTLLCSFIRRHRFGVHCIWQRRVRWCWAPPPPAGPLFLPIAGQYLLDPATAPMHDDGHGRPNGHDGWRVLCRRLPDDGPDACRVPTAPTTAQPASAAGEGGADLVLASSRCLRPNRLLPFRLRSHATPAHCGGGGVLHFTQSHGPLPKQHGFRRVDDLLPLPASYICLFLFLASSFFSFFFK